MLKSHHVPRYHAHSKQGQILVLHISVKRGHGEKSNLKIPFLKRKGVGASITGKFLQFDKTEVQIRDFNVTFRVD